ncbi:MAG: hypothetical protein MJK15_17880 [Colwellia sp.]|nr:hypothetical protein [Colwellia sp.]
MNIVYVLQARTNSSRLPAKILLPINGIPIVVLAAKRAGNFGEEVIVFTSSEKTDDYLCSILEKYRVQFFRGSLNNTLDRFVSGLACYDENTIVVRLTADNILPDGMFLGGLVEEFISLKLDYLSSADPLSGLPYGMSAEVMYLRSLQEAAKKTTDLMDCEHVTPYVRRKYGVEVYAKFSCLNLAHLRCTIDTLDDYLYMAKIFLTINKSMDKAASEIIQEMDDRLDEKARRR